MSGERKILFILGAGASLGAGAKAKVQGSGTLPIPTQSNFWEIFLRFSKNNQNKSTIESFLYRYFLGQRIPTRLKPSKRRAKLNEIDVEEVFTFLSERARSPSTSSQLRGYSKKVWSSLVSEVKNVFSHYSANSETKHCYKSLLKNHIKTYDAVVSFNYDTVFEKSLPQSQKWIYECVAREQAKRDELPILKPHGSINWDFQKSKIVVSKNPSKPVIVAPTHLKFVSTSDNENAEDLTGYLDQNPIISEIWRSMENRMKDAKALIFIGYSFPLADLYFSSILRSVLAIRDGSPPGVVIVNPDAVAISERISKRFRVSNIVKYFDLEQFVNSSRSNILSNL